MKDRRRKKAMLSIALAGAACLGAAAIAIATAVAGAGRGAELSIFAYDSCGGCFSDGAPCASCSVMESLHQTYYGILEKYGLEDAVAIRLHNTKYDAGRDALEKARGRMPPEQSEFAQEEPLVVIGGSEYFSGESAASRVSEFFSRQSPAGLLGRIGQLFQPKNGNATEILSAGEMAYFYSELCGDCARLRGALQEARPRLAEAGIELAEYDAAQDYDVFLEYMEAYGISHKEAVTPYLFWGDGAYFGADAIKAAWAGIQP
ncbi:MAG: hypothetical protein LBL83_00360 [Clostridiales bacterium]|jgi:hypothetical protein|nr:hypothetical protein [Clostridiales bacterium]